MPATAAKRRNHFVLGMSRRNSQDSPYQTDNKNNNVASPTMTSQARCTVLAWLMLGSLFVGNALRPCTTVFLPVLGSESHDAKSGIAIPPSTFVPFELK